MNKHIFKTIAAALTMLLGTGVAQATIVNGFANGGFETNTGNVAANWLSGGYSINNVWVHSGVSAMRLQAPVTGDAKGLQNSIDDGFMAPLTAGDHPLLSFWASGDSGTTGGLYYALRYLDNIGNIKADSGVQQIGNLISWDGWTEITFDLGVVPVGATAAFVEFVQFNGSSSDGIAFIDDVFLGVTSTAVPVPAAVWLFGSGLLGLVGIARRKSAA